MKKPEKANPVPGGRTIGKMAREAGVGVETIRFYERRGLLPQPKKPASGWRVYDDSALWLVYYIKLGQQLGFTLSEMRGLLANVRGGRHFCGSVQQAYQQKIQLISDKIESLRTVRKELNKALRDCVARSAAGECPIAERCRGQFPTQKDGSNRGVSR